MKAYNWLGVGLQLVGVVVAMILLAGLHETVTGREVVLLRGGRAARSHLRSGALRLRSAALRLMGRTPAPTNIVLGTAELTVSAGTLKAHGVTTRGPMPDGPVGARITWLDDYVRQVERKVNDLSSEVWQQASDHERALSATRDIAAKEISEAVETARSWVLELVGRDVGWEIGALGAVAVGTILAAWP